MTDPEISERSKGINLVIKKGEHPKERRVIDENGSEVSTDQKRKMIDVERERRVLVM